MAQEKSSGNAQPDSATAAVDVEDLRERLASTRNMLAANEGAVLRLVKRNDALMAQVEKLKEQVNARAEAHKTQVFELRGQIGRLTATRSSGAQTVDDLKVRLAAARQAVSAKHAALEQFSERNDALRAQIADLREQMATRSAEERARYSALREISGERLSRVREAMTEKSDLYSRASPYLAVFRQGLLHDEISKSDVDLAADCYLALLPSSVPAALQLKRAHGGMVVCDCVENVEVEKHSLAPRIHSPALELVNLAAYGSLLSSDRLMTVSDAVGQTLTRFGRPVRVVPNYRRFEEPEPAGELRDMCGLSAGDVLLYASGNVVMGFEPLLEALARLPAHIHLATMIRISPAEYHARIMALTDRLGLAGRVHFLPFVPYEKLAGIAADADVGVIILDSGNPNHAVSLPNRFFDYLTSGLPMVAPPLPEVAGLLGTHGCGVTLAAETPEGWLAALRQVLADRARYQAATIEARRKITWESNEDELFEFLGRPQRLTMLGFRDLSRYQRFQRIARTLSDHGTRIKAVFLSADPLPTSVENAEFYHFEDRYGRGPGLSLVPRAD